jgi:hypothetical protein
MRYDNQEPGLMAAILSLPRLVWQAVRGQTLSGGWLPSHLFKHRRFRLGDFTPGRPIDIMVAIVDHFEPGSPRFSGEDSVGLVRKWCAAYEDLARKHRDADGLPPQHTWFYQAEYPNWDCLVELSRGVFRGLGEIEFHLHHGNDTHESFFRSLQTGLDWFNQAGAMLTAAPQPGRAFAYIAGNWALDNGTGDDRQSGCNTELLALREAGCYADFTFPALGSPAQPRLSNAIYYAADDPGPKSYNTGIEVTVGRPPSGDLMLIQGPLLIDWARGRFEGSALESFAPPSPFRLPSWLAAHIHVVGRPEWVFVKLHTHGLQSWDAFLGPGATAMFEAMTSTWNQGPFRLHFVTAREMYNIIKAAEEGLDGNPNLYRDHVLPLPVNRRIFCGQPWQLNSYGLERIGLSVANPRPGTIEFAQGPLHKVSGAVKKIEALCQQGKLTRLEIDGEGWFEVQLAAGGLTASDLALLPGDRIRMQSGSASASQSY